jgi:hypothetical protein
MGGAMIERRMQTDERFRACPLSFFCLKKVYPPLADTSSGQFYLIMDYVLSLQRSN